eukprot:12604920-Ditylum_brightwellii.AAC.1
MKLTNLSTPISLSLLSLYPSGLQGCSAQRKEPHHKGKKTPPRTQQQTKLPTKNGLAEALK